MERTELADLATPERLVAAVTKNVAAGVTDPHGSPEGEHPDAVSVRTAEHEGHSIVIRTRYEIEVDGRPFQPHLVVDNAGRVHYHGLPTRDFASMVDLVKKAVDSFPEDFAADRPGQGHAGGQDHGHGGDGGGHESGPAPGHHPGTEAEGAPS